MTAFSRNGVMRRFITPPRYGLGHQYTANLQCPTSVFRPVNWQGNGTRTGTPMKRSLNCTSMPSTSAPNSKSHGENSSRHIHTSHRSTSITPSRPVAVVCSALSDPCFVPELSQSVLAPFPSTHFPPISLYHNSIVTSLSIWGAVCRRVECHLEGSIGCSIACWHRPVETAPGTSRSHRTAALMTAFSRSISVHR